MTAAPDDEEIERAIVRVADLLYVVRSNLQHGEKFASPDPVRISRDRLISEKVTRVLALFLRPAPSAGRRPPSQLTAR
jgi:hypothetical protein